MRKNLPGLAAPRVFIVRLSHAWHLPTEDTVNGYRGIFEPPCAENQCAESYFLASIFGFPSVVSVATQTFSTMVASAVFITDLQGKAIISRNYKGDVSLNKAIERFQNYLTDVEDEAKKPVFYVDTNGDVLSGEDVGATGTGGEHYVYVSVSTICTESPFLKSQPKVSLGSNTKRDPWHRQSLFGYLCCSQQIQGQYI